MKDKKGRAAVRACQIIGNLKPGFERRLGGRLDL